jgi:hypothetical protein
MLKHAGMLEPQDPGLIPFDETVDLELRWKEWLRREHNNRYTKPACQYIPIQVSFIYNGHSILNHAHASVLAETLPRLVAMHLPLHLANLLIFANTLIG